MNIVLVEDPRYDVGSFLVKINKKYPTSSRISLNSDNYVSSMKLLNSSPLLTSEWVVQINERVPLKSVVKIFQNKVNINILLLRNMNNLEQIVADLKSENVQFKVLDNTKPNKADILQYVMSMLNITLANAKYLCNRHKYYVPAIVDSVYILSTFDEVDMPTIKAYTKRFGNISFFHITESLLGVAEVDRAKVVELIYQYHYGFGYILNFVLKELEEYEFIFNLMDEGLLTLSNYREIKLDDERQKTYDKIKSYKVQKIINFYSRVSKELMYFVTASVKTIKPRQSEIYKLLMLLK